MTEREKMLSGYIYNSSDPEIRERFNQTRSLVQKYNQLAAEDMIGRTKIMKEIFMRIGENVRINQPFYIDYGCNVEIGNNTFINSNCIFQDANKIIIGAYTLIGPDVKIYTAYHPMNPKERFEKHADNTVTIRTAASPVTIGDNTWIGGSSIILSGVSIGNNVIIGAGSVVTKSIPDNVIAFGNPCKVIREIEDIDL